MVLKLVVAVQVVFVNSLIFLLHLKYMQLILVLAVQCLALVLVLQRMVTLQLLRMKMELYFMNHLVVELKRLVTLVLLVLQEVVVLLVVVLVGLEISEVIPPLKDIMVRPPRIIPFMVIRGAKKGMVAVEAVLAVVLILVIQLLP